VAQRLAIEAVRIVLPITLIAVATIALFDLYSATRVARWTLSNMIALSPATGLALGLAAFAFVAIVKWTLMGRYRPTVAPLWSRFVWFTEMVTTFYEYLAVPLLLDPLRGTPYLAFFLRILGATVGRRTFIETTDFTEFDLVSIGDDAALNEGCGCQTHLFEDRIMKLGPVAIGARSAIGSGSIVLYDASVGAEAKVGDLSIIMKGEAVPCRTSWEGSPARPACDHIGGSVDAIAVSNRSDAA
jgi:non-ribosomal peptide synthetase-like protein